MRNNLISFFFLQSCCSLICWLFWSNYLLLHFLLFTVFLTTLIPRLEQQFGFFCTAEFYLFIYSVANSLYLADVFLLLFFGCLQMVLDNIVFTFEIIFSTCDFFSLHNFIYLFIMLLTHFIVLLHAVFCVCIDQH